MRKFIPYILIITLIANIFAPFSVEAEKITSDNIFKPDSKIIYKTSIFNENTNTTSAQFEVSLVTGYTDKNDLEDVYTKVLAASGRKGAFDENAFIIYLEGYNTDNLYQSITKKLTQKEDGTYYEIPDGPKEAGATVIIDGLKPGKEYVARFYYLSDDTSGGTKLAGVGEGQFYEISSTGSFITKETSSENDSDFEEEDNFSLSPDSDLPQYTCGVGWGSGGTIWGCFAQVFLLFYRITSWLFAAAGMFFDFTFGYSVNDTSYKMSFIESGWGLVRDFVNMFFIFILLYAAISLILNLNSGNAKKMIGSVIIIGLLINFSLFATRVIVDASNILARVFYNHIVLEYKGGSTAEKRGGVGFGNKVNKSYKSLSAGLVNKINPQTLVNNANNVELNKSGMGSESGDVDKETGIGVGAFILVIILAIAINLVGMFVFLNVGLIFLARVIGLALAMVLSPLAFFSLAAPGLKKAKIVGWDSWFKETISLAFLAPIFIFFVYLIVQFVDSGMGLFDAAEKELEGVALVLSIIIPFAFVMVLLKRAGSIAKDMSGEIGQSATSGLKTIGGVALGAGLGGLALAGRSTIGRLANKFDQGRVNDWASGKNGMVKQVLGRGFKGITSAGAKGSFDFRQTKAGNIFSKETGLDLDKYTKEVGLGATAGAGGYAGYKAKVLQKREEYGKNLGYDKDLYAELGTKISDKERELENFKRTTVLDRNSNDYKKEVEIREMDINSAKKEQERVKTGREKWYAESWRKKSGRPVKAPEEAKEVTEDQIRERAQKIYGMRQRNNISGSEESDWAQAKKELSEENARKTYDTVTDQYGNIVRMAQFDKATAGQRASQIGREAVEGFIKGMLAGAGIGALAAGPMGVLIGGVGGGFANAIRQAVKYSGTTNKETGEKIEKMEPKSKYQPPVEKIQEKKEDSGNKK